MIALSSPASAGPTGLFYIPTTDTQPTYLGHIDFTTFTQPENSKGYTGFINADFTIGLTKKFEIGSDNIYNTSAGAMTRNPGMFNYKYRFIDESRWIPSVAVGEFLANVGPNGGYPTADQRYVVLGKHFGMLRVTAGAFGVDKAWAGNLNPYGLIFGVDTTMGRRWSATADTETGMTGMGVSTVGIGYQIGRININPGYAWVRNPVAFGGKSAFEFQMHADL